MTNSRTTECRVVIDTLLFVPALAFAADEARIYALLLRKCCKVVVSEHITFQYQSVMNAWGYSGDAIFTEISRLQIMNKLRYCEEPPGNVGEDLAPRKDRHIVAPCLRGYAHYIISGDRGIKQRGDVIRERTGARVLDLAEAEREFNRRSDCPPDTAGQR